MGIAIANSKRAGMQAPYGMESFDCSKYKTIKTDAHENYTDGELKRAKEIIAMDTTARANRSHARIRSLREQHQLLPLDTEHGMGNSDDEEKQEQKPWHELGFR
jgi:hypothetical protein